MICAALTIDHLRDIYVTDPRLPKSIAMNLHHLFLTLMADQEFKIASSKAYALAFSRVAKLYVNGIGTQENCLFSLSVQFLNRSIYVDKMVYNYGFLKEVATSLLTILEPTKGKFATHPILLHRKYNPVLGDLKVVFTLPDTSRYFCATCIDEMLQVFKLFQFIHPQARQLLQHVEFEGREWMHAFNMFLGFSSLFDYLVNWFVDEKSVENIEGPTILDPNTEGVDDTQVFDPISVEILPTAMELMMAIVSAIVEWQHEAQIQNKKARSLWKIVPVLQSVEVNVGDIDSAITDNGLPMIDNNDEQSGKQSNIAELPEEAPRSLSIPRELREKSFHLFLHRFLATAVREACRHPHHADTLLELQQYLSVVYDQSGGSDNVGEEDDDDDGGESEENQLTLLVDYPLQTIVWECQIRAGMWRRNGHSMLDQILNYSEPPFCRIFKDLDILLIQLCAGGYGINRLINHIIHRFGIFDYLSTKTVKSKSESAIFSKLTESMLLLVITMVTEMPFPAYADQAKRVECMLRREVVHKLVGGMAAYSELQECMGLVPECEKVKSSVLDDVIAHVAECQESSNVLEPSKFKLKEAAWAEYDPCFTHVGEKTHHSALELRPKKSNISKPMCPDFNLIPVHPAFLSVRHCTLLDATLMTLVRDLLRAHMIDKLPSFGAGAAIPPPSHPQYAYFMLQQEWTLRCSAAVFSKTLHLLTLMVHNLSRPKSSPESGDASSGGSGGASTAPPLRERQDVFEAFLLRPGKLEVKHRSEMPDPDLDNSSSRLGSFEFRRGSGDEFNVSSPFNFDVETAPITGIRGSSSLHDSSSDSALVDGPQLVVLPPLLNTIMDIYDSLSDSGTDEDVFNKQCLLWIIGKLENTLSAECGEVIENRMKQELHEKRRLEMKEKREKARERAMSAMKKNATAFAEHMEKEGITASSDEEDEEDVVDSGNDDDSSLPKCIICRSQHRNDSIGYLGLSQLSRYLCVEKDAAKDIHLDATPASNLSKKGKAERNILDENAFLHVQFCGHAMHAGCFDLFFASVIDRAEGQNNLILDPNDGFFQCPFCKKLGNVLLPHTHQIIGEDTDSKDCGDGGFQHAPMAKNDVDWVNWMMTQTSDKKCSEYRDAADSGRHWSDLSAGGRSSPLVSTDSTRSSIGQTSASLKRIHESLTTSLPPNSPIEEEQHQRQRQDPSGSVSDLSRQDEAFEMSISDYRDSDEDEAKQEKTARRPSAMNTLVGLFRDITRYSQNRFSEAAPTPTTNTTSESSFDSNAASLKTTQLGSADILDADVAAKEDLRFKNQNLWFRFMGDLCQPIVPSPGLSSDIQHYELIPLRISSSVSAVAFSLCIDQLENDSFFDYVLDQENQWMEMSREDSVRDDNDYDSDENSNTGGDGMEDQASPEELARLRHKRLVEYFSGKKKGNEGSRKSKNIRLLSMLLAGVGGYVDSVCVADALRTLIVDALIGRRTGGEGKEQVGESKNHWITNICISQRMLNNAVAHGKRSFTDADVASLLWKKDCGGDKEDAGSLVSPDNKYDNGSRRKSDWFSLPILAMPLTDVLVFLLAINPSASALHAEGASNDMMDIDEGEASRSRKEEPGSAGIEGHVSTMAVYLKWICVASIVQTSVAVATDYFDKKCHDEKSATDVESLPRAELEELLAAFPALPTIICNCVNGYGGNSDFSGVKDDAFYAVVETVVTKWSLTLQYFLHVVARCSPELAARCALAGLEHQERQGPGSITTSGAKKASFDPDNKSTQLSVTLLAQNMASLGLSEFAAQSEKHTAGTAASRVVSDAISRWIRALKLTSLTSKSISSSVSDEKHDASPVLSTSDISRLVQARVLKASYPCPPRQQPQFITLPNSYTKLHGILTCLCDYEYPALCMTCGSVINASGKGLCTAHHADCAFGVGVYFLLQDCTVLLLDGLRGTYYPSPYVDKHGEKHRSFRGKPLFIDAKRIKMLSKLWLSHGLPNEVASKRSNSTRVIINGHY